VSWKEFSVTLIVGHWPNQSLVPPIAVVIGSRLDTVIPGKANHAPLRLMLREGQFLLHEAWQSFCLPGSEFSHEGKQQAKTRVSESQRPRETKHFKYI
jgi:hypothetical protein